MELQTAMQVTQPLGALDGHLLLLLVIMVVSGVLGGAANFFLRDRMTVFERLARLGVHCLDVPSRSMPIGLINRYLMIKQRGLL